VSDWGKWEEFYETTVLGAKTLLEAASSVKELKRLLFVSTVDVYGYPKDAHSWDESKPIVETSLYYNKSKSQAEKLAWKYSQKGIPITILRPANIYGPGGKDFVKEICDLLEEGSMVFLSGGKTSAGLTYVDNCARAAIEAAKSPNTLNQAYNITDDGGDVSWRLYVDSLADGIGAKRAWLSLVFWLAYILGYLMEVVYGLFGIKSRPLLTRHATLLIGRDQLFPNSKAKRDFKFREYILFDEAIKKTIEWAKEQRKKNK